MNWETRPEREKAGCFSQLKRLFSSKEEQRNIWEETAEQRRRHAAHRTPASRNQPSFQDVTRGNFGEEQRPLHKPAASLTAEHQLRRKPVPQRAPAVATRQPRFRVVPSRPLPLLPTTQGYRPPREAHGNPVPSRSIPKASRQQPLTRVTPGPQSRPLLSLPTDQSPYREAKLTKPSTRSPVPTSRSTPEKEAPEPQWHTVPVLDMELPTPEHGSASYLFPAPLNIQKNAPSPSVRHSTGLDSLFQKPSTRTSTPTRTDSPNTNRAVSRGHKSFEKEVSAGEYNSPNLDTIPVVPGQAPKEGHFSRACPMSLDTNKLAGAQDVREKGPARIPLAPRGTNNSPADKGRGRPVHWRERDLSAPLPPLPLEPTNVLSPPPPYSPQRELTSPRRPASDAPRKSTTMDSAAVRAVVTWLCENLAHIPYAITSLSALAMWGFRDHLPTHVSILCPEHCRDVITSWAVATSVVLDPRQRGFGLRLHGEEAVRHVRLRFVSAEEFGRFRTVGRGKVLGLASLVDVLAGEFMDMKGEKAGEKRLVLGGGISWAVGRMVATSAGFERGEVRNARNPLFLEPFICTFSGSREELVKAGLVAANASHKERSRKGVKKGSAAGKGAR